MNGYSCFLPPILNLDGEWDVILSRLYAIFSHDFKESKTYHYGLKVIYDGSIKPDGQGKEEGFWHVITREDRKAGDRILDYRRAERLPWAKPLMENPNRPEIKIWQYDKGERAKGIRTYIWLDKYDYVVILQKRKRVYYWVTVFYISSNWKRQDMQKSYKKRIK